MEVSGVVSRQPIRYSNFCRSDFVRESRLLFRSVGLKQKKFCGGVLFRDQDHLQYYGTDYRKIVSEKHEKGAKKVLKMKKKQVKLVKGLRKDLLAFSEMNFGLGADGTVLLADEVKGNMISEAAELLLEQLQKLKVEEKEMKKKMKEEKARLKVEESSSSSSSESSDSSDSDCGGEVVDMKTLKQHSQTNQIVPKPNLPELASPALDTNLVDTHPQVKETPNFVQIRDSSVRDLASGATCSKKIEVCMGGKCKKSGGAAILAEFQRVLGIEGAVSGCKCMGKCKVGPNVKVFDDEDSVLRTPVANSLCIGVGLEDVGKIVNNILGDDPNQIGLAGAA